MQSLENKHLKINRVEYKNTRLIRACKVYPTNAYLLIILIRLGFWKLVLCIDLGKDKNIQFLSYNLFDQKDLTSIYI